MAKQPWKKWWHRDWLADPNLSMCSPEARGIWVDLISSMMGETDVSGKISGTAGQLSRVARCTPEQLENALSELDSTGTASVTDDGSRFEISGLRWLLGGEAGADRKRYARLKRARRRGTHTKEGWEELVASVGGLCVSCGRRKRLTKDHIVPVSSPRSSDSIDNIQPLCQPCNSRKHCRATNYLEET